MHSRKFFSILLNSTKRRIRSKGSETELSLDELPDGEIMSQPYPPVVIVDAFIIQYNIGNYRKNHTF